MQTGNGKARFYLFILLLAVAAAGCVVTGPSLSLTDRPGAGLPPGDAGLAPHRDGRVVVRFLPEGDAETVAATLGADVDYALDAVHAAVLRLPADVSVVEALHELSRVPGVKFADPDYVYETADFGAPSFADGRQWAPLKIGAPVAWERTVGSADVVIAVVDSGVDGSHPELLGKVLPGFNTVGVDAQDTTDGTGHGTHVAAIAAAWGDAGDPVDGMLGMAWDSRILPVKVLSGRVGTTASIAEGIWQTVAWYEEARREHAGLRLVMNLSLGGPGYSQLMQEAVDAALQADIVVVAASGNEGRRQLYFPAAYSGVIAVGATDPLDRPAAFSSYGPHVALAAPGVDIHSAVPGGYARWSGTSMAAPHVSGAAALLLAADPTLTAAQVRGVLEATAEPSPAGRFDERLGFGRLDAGRALGGGGAHEYGSVSVTVVDDVGPVPYAEVLLLAADGMALEARTTNRNGVATFFAVPADGLYRVVSGHGGGAVGEDVAVPGAEVVRFTLHVGGGNQ